MDDPQQAIAREFWPTRAFRTVPSVFWPRLADELGACTCTLCGSTFADVRFRACAVTTAATRRTVVVLAFMFRENDDRVFCVTPEELAVQLPAAARAPATTVHAHFVPCVGARDYGTVPYEDWGAARALAARAARGAAVPVVLTGTSPALRHFLFQTQAWQGRAAPAPPVLPPLPARYGGRSFATPQTHSCNTLPTITSPFDDRQSLLPSLAPPPLPSQLQQPQQPQQPPHETAVPITLPPLTGSPRSEQGTPQPAKRAAHRLLGMPFLCQSTGSLPPSLALQRPTVASPRTLLAAPTQPPQPQPQPAQILPSVSGLLNSAGAPAAPEFPRLPVLGTPPCTRPRDDTDTVPTAVLSQPSQQQSVPIILPPLPGTAPAATTAPAPGAASAAAAPVLHEKKTGRYKIVHDRNHEADEAELAEGLHRCRWEGCAEVFDTVSLLTAHIQVHTLPCTDFVCRWAGCPRHGRPFNNHSGLFRHLRYHTGDKPCKCPVEGCRFSSVDNGELSRHIKLVHNTYP